MKIGMNEMTVNDSKMCVKQRSLVNSPGEYRLRRKRQVKEMGFNFWRKRKVERSETREVKKWRDVQRDVDQMNDFSTKKEQNDN